MVATEKKDSPGRSLIVGVLFGVAFGFLLQKGGVADYGVLIGALRLTDPTVFIVILTAIVVGGITSALFRRAGVARAHPKPTNYASNVVGGLLFGIGFATYGYCPGTGAAAVGQGSWDAAYGVLGMLAGSLVYAVTYPRWKKLNAAGDRGTLTAPTAFHVPEALYLGITSIAFVAILYVLTRGLHG